MKNNKKMQAANENEGKTPDARSNVEKTHLARINYNEIAATHGNDPGSPTIMCGNDYKNSAVGDNDENAPPETRDLDKNTQGETRNLGVNSPANTHDTDGSSPTEMCESEAKPTNHPNKIVFVSRLDADCSLGAFLLCSLAPRLVRKIPNLKISIVGGGSEYEKIREIAEKINCRLELRPDNSTAGGEIKEKTAQNINCELDSGFSLSTVVDEKAGKPVQNNSSRKDSNASLPTLAGKKEENLSSKINRRLINMIGTVENVMDWLSENGSGTLFVGVSRAALEAMAFGLPVILLGNEGFLGLLDEDKLESARKSNYTCRGFGFSVSERAKHDLKDALFEEICRYFELSSEEKARLCELSLREVRENYSVEKMAKMTLAVYKQAIFESKKPRVAARRGFASAASGGVAGRGCGEDVDDAASLWSDKGVDSAAALCRDEELGDTTDLRCGEDFGGTLGRRHGREDESAVQDLRKGGACAKNFLLVATRNEVKIAICGYYGRGNFGDEAILGAIVSQIKKTCAECGRNYEKSVKICVLKSKDPLEICQKLYKSDLFIFGGGSLLQNSTSNASLLYYLGVIALANIMSKRSIMLANGLGPLNAGVLARKAMLYLISRAINSFDLISVRDTASQKLLKEALPNRKIDLIFDPALSLFASGSRGGADLVKIRAKSCEEKRHFVFCPCARGFKSAGVSALEVAKALIELANEHKIGIKLLVLNKNEDGSVASDLGKLTGASVCAPKGVSDLCEVLSGAKFVMSQRYHGTLFSVACEIPTLSLSNDPKMSAFCEDFGVFPSKSPEILRSGAHLRAEISAMLFYSAKNGGKIASNIKKAAAISQGSMQKCFQKFIFPIDKYEQMFYNKENNIGKEDKWLRARKEMR